MTEASQAKLLEEASDLQALLKRVGKATTIMRGIESERESANGRLATLRHQRLALQQKLDSLDGDSKVIEAQIAKLDETITSLRALLQSVYDAGLVQAPAKVVKPLMNGTSLATKPVGKKKRSSYVATGAQARTMAATEARRAAVVEACSKAPMTMTDLRKAFPKLAAVSLRPMVSLMVAHGRLKRSGVVGKYEYSAGSKTNGIARAATPSAAKAALTVRAGVMAACLAGPKATYDLYPLFPQVSAQTLQSAVSMLVKDGKLGRTKIENERGYMYHALKGAAQVEKKAVPLIASVRDVVLASVLEGEKTAREVCALFPKLNENTIQSALNALAGAGKLGYRKVEGQRGFTYTPPGAGKATPREAHGDRVLAACKTPMTFGALAARLTDINPHVLHQTVYTLVNSKKLLRSGERHSGERHTYLYTTA